MKKTKIDIFDPAIKGYTIDWKGPLWPGKPATLKDDQSNILGHIALHGEIVRRMILSDIKKKPRLISRKRMTITDDVYDVYDEKRNLIGTGWKKSAYTFFNSEMIFSSKMYSLVGKIPNNPSGEFSIKFAGKKGKKIAKGDNLSKRYSTGFLQWSFENSCVFKLLPSLKFELDRKILLSFFLAIFSSFYDRTLQGGGVGHIIRLLSMR